MILIDSNIPMHLVGTPHRHKADAQILLETCIKERRRLVTDAWLRPARVRASPLHS